MTPHQIEQATGAKGNTIRPVLWRMRGKPKRGARKTTLIRLDLSAIDGFREEAERRGLAATALATQLLKAITDDKMFDAVLDGGA